MKVVHKKTVEKEVEVLDHYVCDWCGEKFEYEWNNYMAYEFQLKITTHCDEPYGWEVGGDTIMVEDMCRPCVDKLLKLLKDNGIEIAEYDY